MRARTEQTGTRVWRVEAGKVETRSDQLATEEPLEIRLRWPSGGGIGGTTVAVTMRTPGADAELAAGFLYAEGIVERRESHRDVSPSPSPM